MIIRTVILQVILSSLVTAISLLRENNIQIFKILSWKKIVEQKHNLAECSKTLNKKVSQCITFSENKLQACFINKYLSEIRFVACTSVTIDILNF